MGRLVYEICVLDAPEERSGSQKAFPPVDKCMTHCFAGQCRTHCVVRCCSRRIFLPFCRCFNGATPQLLGFASLDPLCVWKRLTALALRELLFQEHANKFCNDVYPKCASQWTDCLPRTARGQFEWGNLKLIGCSDK